MSPLQLVSVSLDVLLVAAAVLAYLARPRLGGQLTKGLRILLVGVMILGLAHLIESALFVVFNINLQVNEVVHRLLIASGFILVILGFVTMRRAFEQ